MFLFFPGDFPFFSKTSCFFCVFRGLETKMVFNEDIGSEDPDSGYRVAGPVVEIF